MKRLLLSVTLGAAVFLSGCAFATTLTTTGATASSLTTTASDFSGFAHIAGYDEIFDRPEGTYVVYLYSLSCANCNAVKQAVSDFANAYAAHEIYFLDVAAAGETGKTHYLSETGQTTVGVPCMLLISAGVFDPEATGAHLSRGAAAVLAMIAAINADGVPFWD